MSAASRHTERVVFSLPRIKRETFVRQAELHRTIESTNTRAMELAASADAQLPLLVLTETQTAGRGRGANVWWSAPGAVTFSLLIDFAEHESAPETWPRFALATSVAVCEALECVVPGHAFGIRWPNDVCHGHRKICGILPELYLRDSRRLVIGVGINANNSLMDAPNELQNVATSVIDLTQRRTNLTNLVIVVLRRIEVRLNDLVAGASELPGDWSRRCLLRNSTVVLNLEGAIQEGQCEGIAADGALLLQSDGAIKRYYAGTIVSAV